MRGPEIVIVCIAICGIVLLYRLVKAIVRLLRK